VPPTEPGEITQLLLRWSRGDRSAADALFPLVYQELRRLARGQRYRQRAGETLNTTAVVHEAYLKLVDARQVSVRDRQHFLALAARAMRQVLVDHARNRHADKRGGQAHHTGLDSGMIAVESRSLDVLALDEALDKLSALEPQLVEIVELRFFAGLSVDETAEALSLAPRTVDRSWQRARAFLHRELREAGSQPRS
jgi:RNA polymerase sigma factor (TIGR02999 family)